MGRPTDYLNTAQFTYVFPDLRGYGSRRDEPGDFTMAEAGADAEVGDGEAGVDDVLDEEHVLGLDGCDRSCVICTTPLDSVPSP